MLLVEAHEPETERAESSSLLIVKPISYIYIYIVKRLFENLVLAR